MPLLGRGITHESFQNKEQRCVYRSNNGIKSFIKTILGGALAAVGLVQVAVFSTAMLAGTAMAENSPPTHADTKEVVRTLVGSSVFNPFSP